MCNSSSSLSYVCLLVAVVVVVFPLLGQGPILTIGTFRLEYEIDRLSNFNPVRFPETWRVTTASTKQVQSFINKCLRRILRVYWPEVITNRDLWNYYHH